MITTLLKGNASISPKITKVHFIAPDAHVIGDVHLDEEISIFSGAVLRGDINAIRVGKRTNIQEHSLLHTSHGRSLCEIGEGVTVGHQAIIHGARVHSNCLIGMGAIILDDSEIQEFSLVGAGALVTEGKTFPARSLIIGSPAKAIRTLSDLEIDSIKAASNSYVQAGLDLKKSLGID